MSADSKSQSPRTERVVGSKLIEDRQEGAHAQNNGLNRRAILLGATSALAAGSIHPAAPAQAPNRAPATPSPQAGGSPTAKPDIVVIWGDDIGISNLSCYSMGLMGYHMPNIDCIAREGMMFTDYYGEQSCMAGRSSFITGQSVFRTGLSGARPLQSE
jgi:hypothetical protein